MKTDSQKLKARAEYFRVQKNTFKEMAFYLDETAYLIDAVRSENAELRKENEILRTKNSGMVQKLLKLESQLQDTSS